MAIDQLGIMLGRSHQGGSQLSVYVKPKGSFIHAPRINEVRMYNICTVKPMADVQITASRIIIKRDPAANLKLRKD